MQFGLDGEGASNQGFRMTSMKLIKTYRQGNHAPRRCVGTLLPLPYNDIA